MSSSTQVKNVDDLITENETPNVTNVVKNIKTEKEYECLISGKDLPTNITHVVINFGAPWCTGCKKIQKEYENLASQYQNIIFAKISIDDMEDLAVNLEITMLPTFMFHDVKKPNLQFGKLSTTNMKEVIKKIDNVLLPNSRFSDNNEDEDF